MRIARTPAELRLWACCPANRNRVAAWRHHKVQSRIACHPHDCHPCHDGCAPEATARAKNKRPRNCIAIVEPDRSIGHPTKCSRPALANCAHRLQRKVQEKLGERVRACTRHGRIRPGETHQGQGRKQMQETPACTQHRHTRATTTSVTQCNQRVPMRNERVAMRRDCPTQAEGH
jgi:hypothetical protein